jgi:large subunit ribosomal protein L18e
MVKRTLPTNPKTRRLIKLLRKASRTNNADLWRTLSDSLSAPTRQGPSINLGKINKLTVEGDFVAVPGKVLGFGDLTKRVDIAALSFSQAARQKIAESGGKAVSLEVLLNLNPRGKKIKLLK